MKKLLLLIVIAGIIGGGVYWFWRIKYQAVGGAEQEPLTVKVERGKIQVFIEATGRVSPNQEVEIKCKASGEVVMLPLDVSDPVKKGDLLVQLDRTDEERSVQRAEVALNVSQAKLNQAKLNFIIAEKDLASERARAKAALKSAETRHEETKARFERTKQLLEKKMVSQESVEIAKTSAEQAEAELENARVRIKDLETGKFRLDLLKESINIAQAQAVLDQISLDDLKQRLDDTRITAPIDGIIAEQNVQVGQIIASGVSNIGGGTTVMTLVDLSRVYVLVSVDESDIGIIEAGQPARITMDAYPDISFRGEVVRVATKGVTVSNVVTFEVKVEVKGKHRQWLKPEMTANVDITVVDKDDVLLLPVQAVARQRREQFVTLKLDDEQTERRLVDIGSNDGLNIEIKSGVVEGDEVVMPDMEGQGRWRQDASGSQNNPRSERMRTRMMSGGARR